MSVTKVGDFQSFQKEVEDSEDALVKFEADWCMPCRAMAPIIEELAKQNPGVKVITVDVEGEGMEPVLEKYKVRAVPTFIRIRRGSAPKMACGTISKDELYSLLKEV